MEVLLVAGNERWFMDCLAGFKKYLNDEVGLWDITILRATGFLDCIKFMWRLLKPVSSGPLLVLYCGHGSKAGWSSSFKYRMLCDLFLRSPKQIFLLNDCCHGGAIFPFLEAAGVSPQKVGVIASSLTDEKSFENEFLTEVMKCWRSHTVYNPGEHAYVWERGGDFHVRQETLGTEKRGGWTIEKVLLEIVLEEPVEIANYFCPRWGFGFDSLLFPNGKNF